MAEQYLRFVRYACQIYTLEHLFAEPLCIRERVHENYPSILVKIARVENGNLLSARFSSQPLPAVPGRLGWVIKRLGRNFGAPWR